MNDKGDIRNKTFAALSATGSQIAHTGVAASVVIFPHIEITTTETVTVEIFHKAFREGAYYLEPANKKAKIR
jgi:hypothetical protein